MDHTIEFGQKAIDAAVLNRDPQRGPTVVMYPAYGLTQYCGYLASLGRR